MEDMTNKPRDFDSDQSRLRAEWKAAEKREMFTGGTAQGGIVVTPKDDRRWDDRSLTLHERLASLLDIVRQASPEHGFVKVSSPFGNCEPGICMTPEDFRRLVAPSVQTSPEIVEGFERQCVDCGFEWSEAPMDAKAEAK